MSVTRHVDGIANAFYSIFIPTMEVTCYCQLFNYWHSSKLYLFCSTE